MQTQLVPLGIDTNYQQFTVNNIDVPDDADPFLLRFQISAGAVDNIANNFYVDDVSLSQVGAIPEPTTLGLFAMGAVGFVLRRRRS